MAGLGAVARRRIAWPGGHARSGLRHAGQRSGDGGGQPNRHKEVRLRRGGRSGVAGILLDQKVAAGFAVGGRMREGAGPGDARGGVRSPVEDLCFFSLKNRRFGSTIDSNEVLSGGSTLMRRRGAYTYVPPVAAPVGRSLRVVPRGGDGGQKGLRHSVEEAARERRGGLRHTGRPGGRLLGGSGLDAARLGQPAAVIVPLRCGRSRGSIRLRHAFEAGVVGSWLGQVAAASFPMENAGMTEGAVK